MAQLAGVSSRTIDYYTQLGLLRESARSNGKHRLYSTESIKTTKLIKELQKQHYKLDEICRLFETQKDSDLFDKMVNIRRQLDTLQKEVAELYPALQLSGPNQQLQAVSREVAHKGFQVFQALLILLGEPMI